jgi:transposase
LITVTFSAEELERINHERYYHEHAKVRRLMHALWLKSKGLSHQEISELASISSTTVTNYLKRFNQLGLDRLLEPVYHIPKSELESHSEAIKAYFEKHPVSTMKEAAYRIEEMTGIKRSSQRAGIFLKKLGMKYRKTGMVPAKADPIKQEDFKKNAGAFAKRSKEWVEAGLLC